MMTQHTPGPWTVETKETSIGHMHMIQPVRACLYVDHRRIGEASETTLVSRANARLIAAAPDLLQVCRELLKDQNWQCDLIQKLRAAVYKAEGRV